MSLDHRIDRRNNQAIYQFARTHLSGEDARRIAGVSLVCLEGVEVSGGTRGVGVPLVVKILLGGVVVKLFVVFTVFVVELGGHASVVGRHEGGGRCHEGDGDDLGQLCGEDLGNIQG